MYYTITLNPAIDMLTKVENFELGKLVELWDEGLIDSRLRLKQIEDNGEYGKAKTIYFGSRQSTYHFCFYQKDIEQAKKLGFDLDFIHSALQFKNRYEVRMCDEVALNFVKKSLNQKLDMAKLAVRVINSKIKVYEKVNGKKVLNKEWYSLLGEVDRMVFQLLLLKLDSLINSINGSMRMFQVLLLFLKLGKI